MGGQRVELLAGDDDVLAERFEKEFGLTAVDEPGAVGQIELVFTFVASVVFFREKTKPVEVAGILLIVGGILILVLGR